MKKLTLQFGGVKEMLTKEQMKKISGGYYCWAVGTGNEYTFPSAANLCEAQAQCDAAAWSNSYSNMFPQGCDCPGAGDEC